MKDIETLAAVFDNRVLAILAVLVNDISDGLYLREISRFSHVSDATTFRIIQKLVDAGLVDLVQIKNLKIYKMKKSEKTDFLFNLLKKEVQLINIFVDKIKESMSTDQIILYGEESSQRANVLIIGDSIKQENIKEIAAELKVKSNFSINFTILTNEQFQSMANTGLFSGKKRVLYKR